MRRGSWKQGLGLLVAGLLSVPAWAQESSGPGGTEPARTTFAVDATGPRLVPAKPEAASGEPVEWMLDVLHPRRDRPKIVSEPLADRLGPSWVYLDGPDVRSLGTDAASGDERSRFVWHLMALEAGEQVPPSVTLRSSNGEEIDVAAEPLSVRTALAEGEDVARPMADFHEVEGGPLGSMTRVIGLLVGLLVLILVALVAWIVRRRRRGRAPEPEARPTPRARFDELVASRTDDRDGVQRLAFGLTGVLREAFPAGDPGNTDPEWVEALRSTGRLAPERFAALEGLVSTCERIKYAALVPTRFAVDELLGDARQLLGSPASPTSATPDAPAKEPAA